MLALLVIFPALASAPTVYLANRITPEANFTMSPMGAQLVNLAAWGMRTTAGVRGCTEEAYRGKELIHEENVDGMLQVKLEDDVNDEDVKEH